MLIFCDHSRARAKFACQRLRRPCEGLFARISTCTFTIGFSKSNLVRTWFLQWSTFILKQPSRKLCKPLLVPACVLRVKVHFDIQKLIIKFDIVCRQFVPRLSRLHTCVFGFCDSNQPSRESCTSSLFNLLLAPVFYTLAFWNCSPLRYFVRVHFEKP